MIEREALPLLPLDRVADRDPWLARHLPQDQRRMVPGVIVYNDDLDVAAGRHRASPQRTKRLPKQFGAVEGADQD
jgi:hypothetical protein